MAVLAQDLRDSVLQAALQGKLTEQLSTDSSVDELLEKIKKEKEQLIKAKKIKKENPLPPIEDEDKPFEIPSNWRWVYLGDIFMHNAGKALNSKNTKGTLKEYITTSNVYEDHFELDNLKKMYYTNDEIEKYSIKKNDLLVLEGGDVGRTAIWNFDKSYCIQNHIHKLRPYISTINIKLYFYILNHFKKIGLLKGKGIAIQGLSSNVLHKILIPLPPIEEQIRIVKRIEELIAKIDEYEKIENRLEEIKKAFPNDMKDAILQAAMQGKLTEQLPTDSNVDDLIEQIKKERKKLEDEGKIKKSKSFKTLEFWYNENLPSNWKVCNLENISYILSDKNKQIKQSDILQKGKYPVISQSLNTIEGYCNDSNKVLKNPNIIIVFGDHSKTLKYINFDFVIGADGTKLIVPIKINEKFLYYVLQSNLINLPQKDYGRHFSLLKKYQIPIPPIEEQQRIVEQLDKLLPLCDDLK